MKSRTKTSRDNLLTSGAVSDCKFDNSSEDEHLNDDYSSANCPGKIEKEHKKKRKASQDDGISLEQLQHRRKFKLKKEKKTEINSQLEKETLTCSTKESDESDTKQDNTPESLKKKKKLKNKKKKLQHNNVQSNNSSTVDYLRKWKNDRSNWKFEKVKQIRLTSNMFNNEKLPDDCFSIFLEYIGGGTKSVKELITKLANEVVEEMERWESLNDAEKETTPKVDENKYERARTVLQLFQ